MSPLAWVEKPPPAPEPAGPSAVGIAYLVGAGPGDPELITVKGLACLRRADMVLYDRLVHPALVDQAPVRAERVYCGKAPRRPAMAQRQIEALMVERVRAGQVVVRLKGGDPFVFGRGGEEGAALSAAGLPWQVIPGVTSVAAVPALAGIPLTHRGVAASFAVVAGHRARGAVEVPQGAAESAPVLPPFCHGVDTLVVLMGAANLPDIALELLADGRPGGTPVAIVERGSLPDQQVRVATLGELAEMARRSPARSPAILVVGEVVRLRSQLARCLELPVGQEVVV